MTYPFFKLLIQYAFLFSGIGLCYHLMPAPVALGLAILIPVLLIRRRFRESVGYNHVGYDDEILVTPRTSHFTRKTTPQRFTLFLVMEVMISASFFVFIHSQDWVVGNMAVVLQRFVRCTLGSGAHIICFQ
jgi:hypothetical protein